MASLTPLSKGLIALAVMGAMASAVWHLGLKDMLGGSPAPETLVASSTAQPTGGVPNTPTATISILPPPAAPDPVAAPRMGVQNNSAARPEPTPAPMPSEVPPAPAQRPAPAAGLSSAENAEAGRKLLDSKSFAQARPYLERAVQGGDGGAACHLGDLHLKGQGGLAVDREKAASFYQLAQSRNTICFASG